MNRNENCCKCVFRVRKARGVRNQGQDRRFPARRADGPPDDDDTISLTAPADVDFSGCKRMQVYNFVFNVYKDYKGYLKAKVIGFQA